MYAFYERLFSTSHVRGHACEFIKMCVEMMQTHGIVRIKAKKWSTRLERHPGGKKGDELLARSMNRYLRQKPRLRKGDQVSRRI